MEIKKVYDPGSIEERWYRYWIEKRLFVADPCSDKPPFSMVIPPPNVTGSLHMGHALNNTLQDVLVRYKKMDGFNVLWLPGTDHAGIATQNVVERMLREKGISRDDLSREEFLQEIWKWKDLYGKRIIHQLQRLGAGCDWTRERFTMDEGLSRAVRIVFNRLFEEDLIYRERYMVNWCPRCGTALSDLEVEHREVRGRLYYIDYPLKDGNGSITIATTRPETMLGDTAVAVHPEDERYRRFHGKELILPLTGRVIPVVTDDYVDASFGTGALKITPAHDPNDFVIGKRHGLPQITVIGKDGRMTPEAGERFAGLDRFRCREEVVEALKALGLLSKVEEHTHAVGHCYRCDTVIEPLITLQWFVKMAPLAEPAIEAVRSGRIRFIPKGWENTYFSWMEGIRDWCISRQIYWGHRIPVWYCGHCDGDRIIMDVKGEGEFTYSDLRKRFSHEEILSMVKDYRIEEVGRDSMIPSESAPEACPRCGGRELVQDPDVLDTWFSSALWPFSTMGWPEKTKELEVFYPTSTLVTSFDIIFFWVARMIMMGLKFMGDVPFRDVYIHALVRDIHGQKMSKSRGNVIDPLVMMERYGTDALRFTLVALAAQGRDIRLSEERMEGYRNFVNKVWNASRFVFMGLDGYRGEEGEMGLMERWILSRLQKVIEEVRSSLDEYRFNDAASTLYQFLWHEFCDWYIEASKPILRGEMGEERKRGTQWCLLHTLGTILKLLHPFMPFVTEEIWNGMGNKESIVLERYPLPDPSLVDEEALEEASFLMEVVKGVRNVRVEASIPPTRPLEILYMGKEGDRWLEVLKREEWLLKALARVSCLTPVDKRPFPAAPLILKEGDLFVSLKGVIDLEGERRRLEKKKASLLEELALVERRLSNKDFLNRAPREVVEREKGRREDLSRKIAKIQEQMEWIRAV